MNNKKAEKGKFVKGKRAGPGRPKGRKNKFTDLKTTFLEALQELGGREYIINFGKKNPRDFLKIIAIMLPRDNKVDLSGSVRVKVIEDDNWYGNKARLPASSPASSASNPPVAGAP